MNNLCCVINPHGQCNGCGAKWCKECANIYGWTLNSSTDHAAALFNKYRPTEVWKCPIVGKVTLATDNIYSGWTFIPYEQPML